MKKLWGFVNFIGLILVAVGFFTHEVVLMQNQLHGIDIQPAQTFVRLVVCAVKDIGKRRTDGAGLRLRALRL